MPEAFGPNSTPDIRLEDSSTVRLVGFSSGSSLSAFMWTVLNLVRCILLHVQVSKSTIYFCLVCSKHVETIMSKVVAPELRALEAIKKEMALRVELRQRMQDANARHLKEYDAMKQEHYKTVEKVTLDF